MSGSTRAITLTLSVRDADTVRRELEKLGPTGEAALQRLEAAAQKVSGRGGSGGGRSGFAGVGAAVGQAGFQIQDFAVQVQAGTSALTALSQQGSQLLGVFGTGGGRDSDAHASRLGLDGAHGSAGPIAGRRQRGRHLAKRVGLWRSASAGHQGYGRALVAQGVACRHGGSLRVASARELDTGRCAGPGPSSGGHQFVCGGLSAARAAPTTLRLGAGP